METAIFASHFLINSPSCHSKTLASQNCFENITGAITDHRCFGSGQNFWDSRNVEVNQFIP